MHTLILAAAVATADLILVGGRVHTMDATRPEVTALAVKGSRIVAAGTDAEVRQWAGPATRVLDLGGRAVIPGLIDTHTHAFEAMRNRVAGSVDLGIPGVHSLAEAVAAVKRRAPDVPDGAWVLGDRWATAQPTWSTSPAMPPSRTALRSRSRASRGTRRIPSAARSSATREAT
jgi:predicted amidohydrolase YtcJ